mgnify:CR=1 FL=1
MHDGLVTIVAKRRDDPADHRASGRGPGEAKVVNAERIPGGPVTLELVNVPRPRRSIAAALGGWLPGRTARGGGVNLSAIRSNRGDGDERGPTNAVAGRPGRLRSRSSSRRRSKTTRTSRIRTFRCRTRRRTVADGVRAIPAAAGDQPADGRARWPERSRARAFRAAGSRVPRRRRRESRSEASRVPGMVAPAPTQPGQVVPRRSPGRFGAPAGW